MTLTDFEFFLRYSDAAPSNQSRKALNSALFNFISARSSNDPSCPSTPPPDPSVLLRGCSLRFLRLRNRTFWGADEAKATSDLRAAPREFLTAGRGGLSTLVVEDKATIRADALLNIAQVRSKYILYYI
jgi:hypothetical protein